ncbi:MAG: Crp/Fnr family transcriptional regulator [Nitrosomonadales bacterium]|nr:Crp/Fnr family transcriptional regulator [Nitrosomonadales bacterium]
MAALHNPNRNHLLAALPQAEFERLLPHLELVPMPLGEVLCKYNNKLQYVYFPTTAIVTLHYVMENGASGGIAEVGNDGMLGVSLFMGGNALPCAALVITAGYGYRLKAALLLDEFNRGGAMQHLLLCYTQALLTQTSQTIACNRHHSLDQQLCRWLLLTLDRQSSNELILTHELVAYIIGVRREGITKAAKKLQQAGIIRYSRGRITVLDRCGLEDLACECYDSVKQELGRLVLRNPDSRHSADHATNWSRIKIQPSLST